MGEGGPKLSKLRDVIYVWPLDGRKGKYKQNFFFWKLTWHEADPARGHQGSGRVQGRKGDVEENGQSQDMKSLKEGDDSKMRHTWASRMTHDANTQWPTKGQQFGSEEIEKDAPANEWRHMYFVNVFSLESFFKMMSRIFFSYFSPLVIGMYSF